MGQTPPSPPTSPRSQGTGTVVSDDSQVQALLGALEDEDCRAILEATTGESLTASELSERCDLPQSTAYRKLELLTDAGLVDERLRLARNGKHTSEYVRSVEDVHVSIGRDIELSVTHSDGEETDGTVPAGAD